MSNSSNNPEGNAPGIQHISAALKILSDNIEDAWTKAPGVDRSISTGFPHFDELIQGLFPGEITVIASRPFAGKTTFSLNIAQHVALDLKIPVLIFSPEWSAPLIAMRLACQIAGVEMRKIRERELSREEKDALDQAVGMLRDAGIYLVEMPHLSTEEVAESILRFQNEISRTGLVIVDDMDYLSPGPCKIWVGLTEEPDQETLKQQNADRAVRIKSSMKAFRKLAKNTGLHFILVSSLSRALKQHDSKIPLAYDDPEVSLMQEADLLVFIKRTKLCDENNEPENEAEIIIARNKRGGPTGTIYMKADMKLMRFADYT
jgi:replicative DNA helicase